MGEKRFWSYYDPSEDIVETLIRGKGVGGKPRGKGETEEKGL